MTKFDNIKSHVKENKMAYISGSIGVLVGVVGTIVGMKFYKSSDIVKNVNMLRIWSPGDNNIHITIPSPGNLGNIVQDLTTGVIYPSQGIVAKSIGVTKPHLSRHLNGKCEDVSGHVFKKLVDGSASHEIHTV